MAARGELRIPLLVAQMGKILKHLILPRLEEAAAAKMEVQADTLAGAAAVGVPGGTLGVLVFLDRVLREVPAFQAVMLVVVAAEPVVQGVMDVPREERVAQA